MHPETGPGERYSAAMAYDARSDRIILFGGYSPSGGAQGDTWAYDYDTDTWSEREPAASPTSRNGHGLAYDAQSDRVILFGGGGPSGILGDTWAYEYEKNTWTQMSPSAHPARRYLHAMAYDAQSDRVILFGGDGGSGPLGDTWAYDYHANTWTEMSPLTAPSVRSDAAMAYDAQTDQIIMFGGDSGGCLGDTWAYEYEKNTWTQMTLDPAPSVRRAHKMAYAAASGRTVLFGGGVSASRLADTWAFRVFSMSPVAEFVGSVRITGDLSVEGGMSVDHADEADHALNADHATTADTATNAVHADEADHAATADTAANAAHADEADHATSADTATSAEHAATADSATTADTATNAAHADEADHATAADTATDAAHADDADHATSADTATNADHADEADHATSADTAGSADHATTADSAATADTATSAAYADEAGHAATADNADMLDGYHAADFWSKIEGGPFVELAPLAPQTGAAVNLIGGGMLPTVTLKNNGLALRAIAGGGESGDWANVETPVTPCLRWWHAMAYDPGSGRTILFGGRDGYGNALDDTWAYDGSTWTQLSPATAPPGRFGHAMAYDAQSGEIILFGGSDANGVPFGDTWAYDYNTNTWTEMSPATAPSARIHSAVAYDAKSERVILFGGYAPPDGLMGDTWAFDCSTNTWTEMHPATSPSSRNGHRMAYDAKSERVILFGGADSSGYLGDTWAYDYNANTWTHLGPAASPAARYLHAMAYDAQSERVILFGGEGASGVMGDTWAYDGSTWTQMSPATAPSARRSHGMAYDAQSDQIIVFGGADVHDVPLGDTWAYSYNTDAWTQLATDTTPSSRHSPSVTYDAQSDRVVMFGGYGTDRLGDTWAFDLDEGLAAEVVGSVRITGDLLVEGEKNAVVPTETFGERKVYCQESTEVWFEHIGSGELQDGVSVIQLDPVFLETVQIDDAHPICVFITPTSDIERYYVTKGTGSFTVVSKTNQAGTFDYRVVAKRRGYEDAYMEPTGRR
jgi:N-acetylneuraminic acid mutarotase